jgi:hypothetical protein
VKTSGWSYGDSNPGPLACHPAAGRPPQSICAGHRPTTSARVPRNPGRLLYFAAVPLSRRGWSWPPQPAGTRPVRACNNSAGRASRDPGTRPEPKATKSQAPARPAAPTTLASARPACLRRSRNAWKCCPGRNHPLPLRPEGRICGEHHEIRRSHAGFQPLAQGTRSWRAGRTAGSRGSVTAAEAVPPSPRTAARRQTGIRRMAGRQIT